MYHVGLGRLAVSVALATATGCGSSSDAVTAPGAPTVPPSLLTTDPPSTTTTTAPARIATTTTRATPAPSTTTVPTTTVDPTTTAPTTVPVVFLRAGDEGPEVSGIQRLLAQAGYLDTGYVDGVFDRATNRAVLAFQGDYGLIVDGVVGPDTTRSLRAAAASIAAS